MKKLLKKIGVLGLIIAILAPFIELPTVNAAEGCTNHLQNYLWLDMNIFEGGKGKTFMEGYSKDTSSGGYQTYTNFPFAFKDTNSSKVTIKSIDMNNLVNTDSFDNFWTAFNKATSSLTSYDIDSKIGGTLVTSAKLNNYTDDTILLHGVWSSFDRSGTPIESNWKEKVIDGKNYSLQPILKTKNDENSMSIKFKPAKFSDNSFGLESGDLTADYFQKVVDDNYNVWGDSTKSNYIPLSITRTLNLSADEIKNMLDDYVFGYYNETDKKWYAVSTVDGTKVEDVKKSYTALIGNDTSRKYIEVEESEIDFNTSKPYYWPAVLSVEYEACPLAKENWTLEYNGNVDDNSVTNIPNKQTTDLGNDITVDSKKPSRADYTFTKWCENPNGSGQCYNAGDKVKSPDSAKTITLFAQWGKGGTEDNKKTGVMSYVIGFISVGIIAGGIYLVAKKKNLFKQI